MRAMVLRATTSLEVNPAPLELTHVEDPEPAAGEILISVLACT